MTRVTKTIDLSMAAPTFGEGMAGSAIGFAFTFALFFGMAHFENPRRNFQPEEIEEVRLVNVPFYPPPPPKVVEPTEAPEAVLPFSGLAVEASDSPVSVAVVPPDLEKLIPTTSTPKAIIQFGRLDVGLKPKVDINTDVNRVFQDSDVDQRPQAIVRTTPEIPFAVRSKAPTLRIVLLVRIGLDGRAETVRVSQSSGNAEYDANCVRVVQEEWVFSPAIRRGKKVRCLIEQPIRLSFGGSSSPFDIK